MVHNTVVQLGVEDQWSYRRNDEYLGSFPTNWLSLHSGCGLAKQSSPIDIPSHTTKQLAQTVLINNPQRTPDYLTLYNAHNHVYLDVCVYFLPSVLCSWFTIGREKLVVKWET